MPTLSVRAVGMSYMIEGLKDSGLDSDRLYRDLSASYGHAVAPIAGGEPKADTTLTYESLIIDRKAAPWPTLLDRLERWVMDSGCTYAEWSDEGMGKAPRSTLHFYA